MKSSPLTALFPTLASVALLFLVGCASTPQSRIESNPAIYDGLNNSQQALVSRGRIAEGMSSQAVFLAWGRPDYIKKASDRGKVSETWIYRGSEPVYTSYAGYGYRRYGYYCPSYTYAPRVYYRSYVAGKVTFRNGRVVQWEVTG